MLGVGRARVQVDASDGLRRYDGGSGEGCVADSGVGAGGSASLGMTIGARGLTERGWSGRVSNPPLRGGVS